MIGISIAGFDPSGGAGIINDMKTFSSLGIYGTAVITVLTSQNPKKVFSLQPVNTDYIEEQFDSIFDEYNIKYGKIGMLYSEKIIKIVAKKIREYNLKVVVDPVMIASSGGTLSKEEITTPLKKYLLPNCLLSTPNIQEAEILSGMKISTQDDAIIAAKKIGKICNVVITGGHLNGINTIFDGEITTIKKNLIKTSNTHGSGCSLSTAITSFIIKNNDLKLSIDKSLKFVELSIKNGKYRTLNHNSIIKH